MVRFGKAALKIFAQCDCDQTKVQNSYTYWTSINPFSLQLLWARTQLLISLLQTWSWQLLPLRTVLLAQFTNAGRIHPIVVFACNWSCHTSLIVLHVSAQMEPCAVCKFILEMRCHQRLQEIFLPFQLKLRQGMELSRQPCSWEKDPVFFGRLKLDAEITSSIHSVCKICVFTGVECVLDYPDSSSAVS